MLFWVLAWEWGQMAQGWQITLYQSSIKEAWRDRAKKCSRKNFVFLFVALWPLWLLHIFTQWGWLILFSSDHFPGQHKNGESPPNYFFLRTFRAGWTNFQSAPDIASESQHHEESRLIYGPFESTLLDQGFPVELELDACNPPPTGTLLCHL